jgi:hypothetical protein
VTLYCKIKVEKYGVIDLDSLKEEPPKFISKKQYEDYMFCYDVLGNVAKNSSLIKYLPYFKILIKSTNDSEIEFTTFESTSYKYKEMKVQNTSIPLWAVDSIIKINSH